ncbi:MAG: magnesium transporter MgtE [Verrucomicrobia bacterium]|nr:MAG: magnesium transporter MgtE [Verrucomicrobiota bacterium]PYJ62420.1 MAG: magnesium transporter MgtE [Verrucomicrobiota bacterium]
MKISGAIDFDAPALNYARKDFPLLEADASVQKALETIRREGIGERVIYFYAVDERKRLVGVVPTRRLLTAAPDTRLCQIMVPRVIALPAEATVLEACEFFVLYKFLAFPVVDEERRLIGIVDMDVFMESVLESDEPEREGVRDDFFEALGFHLAQVRDASPWRVFRYRFPWLLVSVTGGTICALLAGLFEATLAHSLVIAFFLIMVLGLNESVSAQSMSVTTQALRSARVSWQWFKAAFRREITTALLLGLACGMLVGAIVWIWRADGRGAFVIGGSIALSLISACVIGLGVPSLLHRLKLDPKIAAGPVTLALADIFALVIYFTSAWVVLR